MDADERRIGISGVDTRALTRRIREQGAPNGVIAHSPSGEFDVEALVGRARAWPGLEGMDLARKFPAADVPLVGRRLERGAGYAEHAEDESRPHVVAIDYGSKRNIFRNLADAGARVTVLPATASFDEVMAHRPDGIFLSNGPGDPAATGEYAVPVIRQLLDTGKPLFGICLGHQLLGLAVGAKTVKMHQGHRGANHPVKRLADGRVEITSMNHGFAVDRDTLPANVRESHVSLFDGSNCGIELTDRPAFSVQYHPRRARAAGQHLFVRGICHEASLLMTPIDPYIRTLFLRDVTDPGLPSGHCRRDEMTPHLRARIEEVLSANGTPVTITNVAELADQLFEELVEANPIIVEDHDFAGRYYFFHSGRYMAFRVKQLENNEIFKASDRIGDRYFRDTFEGYIRRQTVEEMEDALRGSVEIPASDRIVTLGDNARPIIDDIETLKKNISSNNDEEGKLTGRRERIVGELSAGQELLKAPSVRVKAILTVLVSTLGFIAAEFAGGIIGDLAVKLLEQIKPLLGI
jgi:carbamoyl-phosphate synthase small subunit